MPKNDKDMLGDFISTVVKFACKMFLWASWAIFRVAELIFGGLASWIKSILTK